MIAAAMFAWWTHHRAAKLKACHTKRRWSIEVMNGFKVKTSSSSKERPSLLGWLGFKTKQRIKRKTKWNRSTKWSAVLERRSKSCQKKWMNSASEKGTSVTHSHYTSQILGVSTSWGLSLVFFRLFVSLSLFESLCFCSLPLWSNKLATLSFRWKRSWGATISDTKLLSYVKMLLVVRPEAPSSVLAPSSKARSP